MNKDYFGPKLKNILKSNGITNKELANAIGVDEQTISNCFTYNINSEYKKTSLPFWTNTVKIINFLQKNIPTCNISYLFQQENIEELEKERQNIINKREEERQKINYIKSENKRLKDINENLRKKNEVLSARIKTIENYFKLPKNLNLFVIKSIVEFMESGNLSSIFYSLLLDDNFLILIDALNQYVLFNSFKDLRKNASPIYLENLKVLFNNLVSSQLQAFNKYLEDAGCEYDSFHIIGCNHYKLRFLELEIAQNLPSKVFEIANIPKEFLSENLNITDL